MTTENAAPATSGPVVLKPSTLPGGQADSRMSLRWCLTDAARGELKMRGVNVEDAYLFVSVAGVMREDEDRAWYNETHRYLVPLTQPELVVWFDYAGLNEIFATVVWHDDGLRPIRKHLMATTSGGRFENTVIDGWEREFLRFSHTIQSLRETSRLRVEVDEGVFGQEPPKWLTGFVGLFYADPLGRVQCDTRRQVIGAIFRLIASLVVVPLVELFQGLVLSILLAAGARGINYAPFRHPYRDGPRTIWRSVSSSRWFTTEDGTDRSIIWLFINPAWALFLLAIWWLITWKVGWPWWAAFAGTAATLLAILLIGLACFAYGARAIDSLSDRRRSRRMTAQANRQHQADESLEALACSRFEERPVQTTVRLRWDHLKARLCKPYARKRS